MKGWRTVAYGVAVGLIGALSTPEMAAFIADHLGWAASAVGTGIVILRAFTNSSIFKNDS